MNLSGERVGHRMDEKLLWGQGARILPQARPLSPAAETILGSGAPGGSPVPAVLRLQAMLLPPEGRGMAPPLPLSPLQRNRERAEVGLGLYAEQPDPRHLVQLGNAFI